MSSEVKWIKIVTDIFDDEKIMLIESMPEADTIITCWFKLLCLAGKQNNCGVFLINNRIPYTDEMFATIFRRPLNTVRLALETFEHFGMIERVDGCVTIPNWEKHQSLDEMERVREQNRMRAANYRAKQKLLTGNVTGNAIVTERNVTSNVTSNATVTERNAIDIDKDKDIDKDNKKKNIKKKNDYSAAFEEIWAMYPVKKDKGAAYEKYVARLNEGYSEADMLKAVGLYLRECQKLHTDVKFIKHLKTFFSSKAPFAEFLSGEAMQDATPTKTPAKYVAPDGSVWESEAEYSYSLWFGGSK